MSRIQDILDKAEREGGVRRTRGVADAHLEPPRAADQYAAGVDGTATAVAPMVPHPGFAPLEVAPLEVAPVEVAPVAAAVSAEQSELAAPPMHAGVAPDPLLVAAVAPYSYPAEEYRALRTRIAQSENGRPLRVIVVTSPASGDGKSVTATNLALTMAQEYTRRVLLLDADLRKPVVHTLLGLPAGPGLAEVLTGVAPLEEAITRLPAYHLAVMPAGLPPHRPAELLASVAMRNLLRTLASQYDRIIVDTPPASPLADVGILSPLADGLLVVVRAGHTPKPAIERTLGEMDASKLVGLVLNDTAEAEARRYGGPYTGGRGTEAASAATADEARG